MAPQQAYRRIAHIALGLCNTFGKFTNPFWEVLFKVLLRRSSQSAQENLTDQFLCVYRDLELTEE